ncbi:NYN domain-containing protein [Candidatus Parcubacteria bacterium]|nr:MAG: NYN domain-containing protein [Candidatus Parcubacteria bacterium]
MGKLEYRRCALFIDFDNMYIGLNNDSQEAAERFATNPAPWLSWIEKSMPGYSTYPGSGKQQRRLLIRKCYLNPGPFGKYRTYFARHGFTVIDCPALTAMGKNSADIVMVMDILDTLNQDLRIDEFILMSADADFTPLFIRLRANDRRTTAIISTPVAAAYRGACDLVVEEGTFVSDGLGITGWRESGGDVNKEAPSESDRLNGLSNEHPLHKLNPELAEFIRRMHDLTEAPMLTPQQYSLIFRELATVLNEPNCQRNSPLKIAQDVRDRCKTTDAPVGVKPISLVLRHLLSHHRKVMLDPSIHHNAETEARNFYDMVTVLLANARAELDSKEKGMLGQWLMGEAE